MKHLWIEIEVLDFDLESIGFFFNVLNSETKEPKSNSYLRMSLVELGVFINALKASAANINLAAANGISSKPRANRPAKLPDEKPLPSHDFVERNIGADLAYSENVR
ncbi:MAG: hypothetical protein OEL78_03615 [Hyphomicrobiales bacterium]|nr:hypothetical protein [Hyphomicrobiales bacterium]